jgi:hypothetical protein
MRFRDVLARRAYERDVQTEIESSKRKRLSRDRGANNQRTAFKGLKVGE